MSSRAMDGGVDDFGSSKRGSSRSFTEAMEGFRFVEIPLSPLLHNTPEEDIYDDQFISPRDIGSRQAFLRSYTFTRADHPPLEHEEAAAAGEAKRSTSGQRNTSLLRLKAAAWAVVACNVKYRLPLRARVLKDKMVIKTSQYLTHSVSSLRSPTMPRCLMAGA